MDASGIQKPPGRRRSSRAQAFGAYEKSRGEAQKQRMLMLSAVGVLCVLGVCGVVGGCIWSEFDNAEVPAFTVERLQVSKFEVDDTFQDDEAVLSAELDFSMNVDNKKNGMLSCKMDSMVMDVNWDKYQAQMGQAEVPDLIQVSGNADTLSIKTHGAATIKMKNPSAEDMKLSMAISGNVEYTWGPFASQSYPFTVNCDAVSTLSKGSMCKSKLYKDEEIPPPPPKQKGVIPAATTTSPSEGPDAADLLAPEPEPADAEHPAADHNTAPAPESEPAPVPAPTPAEPPKPELVPVPAPEPPEPGSPAPSPNLIATPPTGPAPLHPPLTAPHAAPPLLPPRPPPTGPPCRLNIQDKTVVLDNGIIQVTILKPDGFIIGIGYNGVDNILDVANPEDDRGYWDVVWANPGTKGTKGIFDRLKADTFRVIVDREDQTEVSFSRKFNVALKGKAAPFDIDLRYVMLRGVSGVYSYGVFVRQPNWPGCHLPNARLAFKLARYKFRHMVITDTRQRKMPLPEDRLKGRGVPLDYPEAVLLVNPTEPEFKGEVDDKYQYSDESQDIRVHGWICNDPAMGFWQITPSFEFRSGGPNKQFLTSHVGPSVLNMFASAHYSGETVMPKFIDGETWKKVYGPMFLYVNRIEQGQNTSLLWEDAKKKMLEERDEWPYSFVASDDFLKGNQRASVSGRFFVHDRVVDSKNIPANESFIGLSRPGEPGSWQTECKGYQFWTKTDAEGKFTIENVIPGEYNLYGWVDGFVGDYKHQAPVNLSIGHHIDLGDVVYEAPRDGPTLWEIGVPDRTAREFFIPDPNPKYVNRLYVNSSDKFRQYGLWERYTELFPTTDLVYTVNVNDFRKDWFFAQVTRKVGNTYKGTTWQVKFNLDEVDPSGLYKLRIALASTSNALLEVRVNEPIPSPPLFTSPKLGNDNAIARHGIHGLYWLFTVDIPGSKMKNGENILFLTQTKATSQFQGVMYDYLRLEGPQKIAPM